MNPHSSDPRDMQAEVAQALPSLYQLQDLAELCQELPTPAPGLEARIIQHLGIEAAGLTTSVDVALQYLRQHYPGWAWGAQEAPSDGPQTGPMAWLNNRQCAKTGFANDTNYGYRYYARPARTLEGAFAALVLWAESYRLAERRGARAA